LASAVEIRSSAPVAAADQSAGRRPLRVCMVHFSDFHIDSRIQRQARALAERGDEVDCVCLSDDGELPVGRGTVRLHRVRASHRRGGARAYVAGYGRFFAGALRAVSALDRERRFDVVEAHNMPDFLTFAAIRPKLRGVPLILNFHDTFPELFGSLFGLGQRHALVRAVRLEERASAASADAHIFVTEQARDLLSGRGVNSRRSLVVMNTPDEGVFGPRRVPPPVEGGGPARAIYHGGLGERFGVESLVQAFGLLADSDPELSLDVYGPDPEQAAALAALAARVAPDTVRIAPRPTPVEEIPSRIEQAQIGIVPTLRNEFTELLLPVKLLECVHMGLPVVTSRLPVIERYFSDEEVRFCEPGSPESLADAIAEVRARPDEARERALRASARLAEIEWSRQRDRYKALIDELARV
jgi:glycosyltransferase involved in cell wall biosynthesis